MEEDGIVSVWLGNFEDGAALRAYAADEYRDEEEDHISPFNRDFFDGEIWPFDPDFWERDLAGSPSADPGELLEHFSYGYSVAESLKERFPEGLDKEYNAVILVYDFQYEDTPKNPDAPVTFLAAVPYEKDDGWY